jgi:hypothetical protein
MAFLAGLNDGPIFRLKFTLGAIPESKMKTLEELQSLMNADSNYENYRQLLAMIPSTQPCIPYLYVVLWLIFSYSIRHLLIFFKGEFA